MRPLPVTDHSRCAPPPQGGCQHGSISCPARLEWIESTREVQATHKALPVGITKALAAYHRGVSATSSEEYPTSWHRQMADILDPPQPLTIRKALLVILQDEDRLGYDDMADEILTMVRENLLAGWRDYADENAHREKGEPGYVIDTEKVHDYITERLSQ